MSDLRERIEFYAEFMAKQAAEDAEKPRDDLSYVRGLDKGYAGAFLLASKWLREALQETEEQG